MSGFYFIDENNNERPDSSKKTCDYNLFDDFIALQLCVF